MDLHRRRSVLVRMTETGERLETVRISNDPEYLRAVMTRAGEAPEVVLEQRGLALLVEDENGLELRGALTDGERRAWEAVRRLGQAAAADVADDTSVRTAIRAQATKAMNRFISIWLAIQSVTMRPAPRAMSVRLSVLRAERRAVSTVALTPPPGSARPASPVAERP